MGIRSTGQWDELMKNPLAELCCSFNPQDILKPIEVCFFNLPKNHFQLGFVKANMVNETVKLASGFSMPLVGFGLWKVDQKTTADIVYAAIQTGYRLFDGAYDYANEKEAGEGIQRAIKDGIVTREEIFITTKLWNNYHKK